MDFPFPVKRLFKNKVCKVKSDLVPEGFADPGPFGRQCPSYVAQVVDSMGVASADAQGLVRPVTSADRLRNSDHVLYVMTDPGAGGTMEGRVAGFLKMGYKNLYLLDRQGRNHEMKPWCVLDFYIHENLQRRGLGKELFDHMLTDVNIAPKFLAMDRPSDSFMLFVKKHYGLFKTIPQVNNYAIYDDFFSKRPDGKAQYASRVHGRTTLLGRNARKQKSMTTLAQEQQAVSQQGAYQKQQQAETVAAGGSVAGRRNIRSTVSECLNYPQQQAQGYPLGIAPPRTPCYAAPAVQLHPPCGQMQGGPPGTPCGPMQVGPPGTPCGPMLVGPPGTQCGPMQVGAPGTPCGPICGAPPGSPCAPALAGLPCGPPMTPGAPGTSGTPGTPRTPSGQPAAGAPGTPCNPPSAGGARTPCGSPPHSPTGTSCGPPAVPCAPAALCPLVAGGDGSGVTMVAPSTPAKPPPSAGAAECPPATPDKPAPSPYQIMRRSKYVHTPLW